MPHRAARILSTLPISNFNKCLIVLLVTLLATLINCNRALSLESQSTIDFDNKLSFDYESISKRDRAVPYTFFLTKSNSKTSNFTRMPFTADKHTEFTLKLSSDVPPGRSLESRSIVFQLPRSPDENLKEKIMFSPAAHNYDAAMDLLEKNQEVSIEFDIKFDKYFENPRSWLILAQIFQCCNHHPPFSMQVTPSSDRRSDINLDFRIINDDLEQRSGGRGLIFASLALKRDVWHHVKFFFEMNLANCNDKSQVTVWINTASIGRYNGCWGYEPDANKLAATKTKHRLGFDLGIYRKRQSTAQVVYFSRIILH